LGYFCDKLNSMKKISLLLTSCVFAFASHAQTPLALSGISYTQNFNSLGTGLPTGWTVWTFATSTSAGTAKSMTTQAGLPFQIAPDTSCAGLVVGGGFKNYPSANVINSTVNFCPGTSGSSTVSGTYSDRALGVRQVGYSNTSFGGSDSGAAFALILNNTTGLSNIQLSFKLQSLDSSSPRATTWRLDYGIAPTASGSPTTFTAVTTTGVMTTGGNTFSNNTITATLPAAVNNHTNVWIRIATLSATTGSGNRATTAIDDFSLTWTGTATDHTGVTDINGQAALSLCVLGDATSSEVSFVYYAEQAGDYNFAIYDLAGRMIRTTTVSSNGGQQRLNMAGLNLAPGMYIAKMFNGSNSSTAKVMVH
jgi:hypothetical protein